MFLWFASRGQKGSRGGKNYITRNGGGAPIIVVKLLRTDTTLDLSQKGQSGEGNSRRDMQWVL